ncbi:MAG: GNAT family N-acetyltransferase [Peptococcaceae bacterium]|nr:GNAT family N-acetyltransferase [Peptococcaceae bacterium]
MRSEDIELIIPTKQYNQSYLDAIGEYKSNNVDSYEFLDPTQCDIYKLIEAFRLGHDLPGNYVPSTYLWLIGGDEFIGEISIRHKLTEALLRYGGHIGYGIRYSKWNKGYATLMLSKALLYAKENIGINKVLLTCGDNNFASACIIERNVGVLQDTIINNIDGVERPTRRYWITL